VCTWREESYTGSLGRLSWLRVDGPISSTLSYLYYSSGSA
jgi:hypothetical protein